MIYQILYLMNCECCVSVASCDDWKSLLHKFCAFIWYELWIFLSLDFYVLLLTQNFHELVRSTSKKFNFKPSFYHIRNFFTSWFSTHKFNFQKKISKKKSQIISASLSKFIEIQITKVSSVSQKINKKQLYMSKRKRILWHKCL